MYNIFRAGSTHYPRCPTPIPLVKFPIVGHYATSYINNNHMLHSRATCYRLQAIPMKQAKIIIILTAFVLIERHEVRRYRGAQSEMN